MINNGTHDLVYGGQLFVINNGQVNVAGGAYQGSVGIDIPMDAATNVLSFMYVGWEDTLAGATGMKYAVDTVTIRIGETAEDITNSEFIKVDDIPVSVTATDVADTEGTFDASEFIASNWYSIYSKNQLVEPDLGDMTVTYTDGVGEDAVSSGDYSQQLVRLSADKKGSFAVTGTYNTTGFAGAQAKGLNYSRVLDNYYGPCCDFPPIYDSDATHDVVEGVTFWVDANGVQMLEDGITASLYTTTTTTTAQSQVAVFAISASGYWDLEQDVYGAAGIDWDGMFSSSFNSTTAEGMFGTFDFGIAALATTYGGSTATGVTNTGTVTSTNTIDVTQTSEVNVTNEETVTSTVATSGGVPGFTGVAAMASVAVLAYMAPRFRKEE
jgi:hypothetical protein